MPDLDWLKPVQLFTDASNIKMDALACELARLQDRCNAYAASNNPYLKALNMKAYFSDPVAGWEVIDATHDIYVPNQFRGKGNGKMKPCGGYKVGTFSSSEYGQAFNAKNKYGYFGVAFRRKKDGVVVIYSAGTDITNFDTLSAVANAKSEAGFSKLLRNYCQVGQSFYEHVKEQHLEGREPNLFCAHSIGCVFNMWMNAVTKNEVLAVNFDGFGKGQQQLLQHSYRQLNRREIGDSKANIISITGSNNPLNHQGKNHPGARTKVDTDGGVFHKSRYNFSKHLIGRISKALDKKFKARHGMNSEDYSRREHALYVSGIYRANNKRPSKEENAVLKLHTMLSQGKVGAASKWLSTIKEGVLKNKAELMKMLEQYKRNGCLPLSYAQEDSCEDKSQLLGVEECGPALLEEDTAEIDVKKAIWLINEFMLDLKVNDPIAYYSLLAEEAMQGEDYQSVLQYCEQGLAADSNNRGFLTSKAFAYSRLGQHQKAYDVLRHFTELSEEDARLLLDSVNGVKNVKQTPDAIAEARVNRDLGYVDESKAHSETMQKLYEAEVRAREVLLESMREQREKSEADGSVEEVNRLDKEIDEYESGRNKAAQSALEAKRDITRVEYERYAFTVNSVSLVWDVFFHALKYCYDKLPGGLMPAWVPSAGSLNELKHIITPLFQNLISFFQKYDVHKISIKEFESYLKAEKSGLYMAGELTVNEGQQIGLYLARLFLFIYPEEITSAEQREKSWQAFLDKWEMISSSCFVLYDACKTVKDSSEFDKVTSLPHRLLSVFRTFKRLFVDADRDAEGLYKTDLHTVRMHLFFDSLSESIFLKFVGHADTIRRLSTWGMLSFDLMSKQTAASLIDTVPILNSVAVLAVMSDAYSQADAGAGAEAVKRIKRNAEMLHTKADELVVQERTDRAVEYFHRSQRLFELHFPERHVVISEIMRKKLKANGKFEVRGGFPQHDSFFHAVACYMVESPEALKAMVDEVDHAQPREALEQAIRRPIYVLDDDANVQVQGDPQQPGHPIFLRQTEAGYVALLAREERYFEDVYAQQPQIAAARLGQNRSAIFHRISQLSARIDSIVQPHHSGGLHA